MTTVNIFTQTIDHLLAALTRLKNHEGHVNAPSVWVDGVDEVPTPQPTLFEKYDAVKESDLPFISHLRHFRSSLTILKHERAVLFRLLDGVDGAISDMYDAYLGLELAVGIRRLPNALLSKILEFGMDFYDSYENKYPVKISQVCKRFREVALLTPSLWSKMLSHNPIVESEVFLSRSKGVSLSIYIGRPRSNKLEVLHQFLDLVTPHSARWSSLFLVSSDADVLDVLRSYPAPSLPRVTEYLTPRSLSDASALPQWELGKLVHITGHTPLPFVHWKSTLMDCHLSFDRDLDLNALSESLRDLSSLETLTVEFYGACRNNNQPFIETELEDNPLPNLKAFKFMLSDGSENGVVMDFLRRSVPLTQLVSLSITLEYDEYATVLADLIQPILLESGSYSNLKNFDFEYRAEIIDFEDLLFQMPQLEHLTIGRAGSRPIGAESVFLDDADTPWSYYQPLKTLSFLNTTDLDEAYLVALGDKLTNERNAPTFQMLCLFRCEDVDERVLRRLELRMNGKLEWTIQPEVY
ncbi:hypothetical protein BD410DRAFT_829558 [Rickenella mellea]|uniref:Uncharacterized protein n=1 Tax=Rickenella mellea TaxID=50990 RepID=A0A4Y7Q0E7_9AGAM|nr:hypothetical protein BD410DRAFT_829558 [Rickenella mellea]